MYKENELMNIFKAEFPSWSLNLKNSGVSIWLNLNDNKSNYFELQFTPSEGIGVSVVRVNDFTMSGHDEAFQTIEETISYLKRLIS